MRSPSDHKYPARVSRPYTPRTGFACTGPTAAAPIRPASSYPNTIAVRTSRPKAPARSAAATKGDVRTVPRCTVFLKSLSSEAAASLIIAVARATLASGSLGPVSNQMLVSGVPPPCYASARRIRAEAISEPSTALAMFLAMTISARSTATVGRSVKLVLTTKSASSRAPVVPSSEPLRADVNERSKPRPDALPVPLGRFSILGGLHDPTEPNEPLYLATPINAVETQVVYYAANRLTASAGRQMGQRAPRAAWNRTCPEPRVLTLVGHDGGVGAGSGVRTRSMERRGPQEVQDG